ncbi:acyltransferase [Selenomonas sp. ND2010]|uniref:acyltransferase family protein n=1 Tax=Selenomonas sp. ND2010 TaxID=1410618 RepID=UPI00051BAA72|nr:acyltransferase [Selenomonas sp. ND2010]
MRLNFITNIKTSMMIMVVFYHCCMFYTGNWVKVFDVTGDERIIAFTAWLNSFHVPAFVMASGYLLYYLAVEKKHYFSTKDFLGRKVQRILKPYVLTSLLWVCPIHYFLFGGSGSDFFYKYVLGISPSQLWFLLMLWWLLVGFYLALSRRMLMFGKRDVIICVLLFAGGVLFARLAHNMLQIGSAMQMSIYFYFGCYLRYKKLQPARNKVFVATLLALVSGYTVLFAEVRYIAGMIKPVFTLAELYLIYCLGQITVEAYLFKTNLWRELSRTSYEIFLIHQQIIYFCIRVFHPRLSMWETIACTFMTTMVVSWLICWGVDGIARKGRGVFGKV